MIDKKNKNLVAALQPYQEGLDLDDEQRLDWLQDNVEGDFVNIEHLKRELEEVLSDNSFDWIGFADTNSLILSPSLYKNEEIANYVKFVLMDFVYPEKELTTGQLEQLRKDVTSILQESYKNDGRLLSYALFDLLKENEQYKDLEYFNLWKINLYNSDIQRKPIEGKYQEIGYLRYKGSPS